MTLSAVASREPMNRRFQLPPKSVNIPDGDAIRMLPSFELCHRVAPEWALTA